MSKYVDVNKIFETAKSLNFNEEDNLKLAYLLRDTPTCDFNTYTSELEDTPEYGKFKSQKLKSVLQEFMGIYQNIMRVYKDDIEKNKQYSYMHTDFEEFMKRLDELSFHTITLSINKGCLQSVNINSYDSITIDDKGMSFKPDIGPSKELTTLVKTNFKLTK